MTEKYRNQPPDVRFIRNLFGLNKKDTQKNPQPGVQTQTGAGRDRFVAEAKASVEGTSTDAKVRISVSFAFEVNARLAESLGLSQDDPEIQALTEETQQRVNTDRVANPQYVPGDLLHPQVRLDYRDDIDNQKGS